jgi:hypothetical protein
MPEVDAAVLIAEDEQRYASGVKGPWRFGYNHATDLSLQNSGTWTEFPNGDRLWRIAIQCPGAYAINFEFHDYVVPEGALVFVYNEEGTQLGAFMAASNPGHTSMGVTQLPGDRITVEYFEPAELAGQGSLRIGQVTHAYRDIFGRDRGFGDSGPCNINVICPEGDDWRDQIRSVAQTTVGGNGFCTGTLVNNCAEDGTPYFLTADHCLDGNVTNWVFRFNWDSPTCDPTQNAPTDQTVAGCQLLVNSAGTDVALLLLNTPPPPDYNVFYSGWDKSGVPAQEVTCIHHPAGDIKKISHSFDPVVQGTFSGADCWHVQAWDDGTTEPGSSGSALWNENKLIIGQLFGGAANCNFNFDDYYGRLDVSWPLLQPWLGDCGDQLPGLGDGPGTPITVDIAVTSITNVPGIVCGQPFITPRITLKNNGTSVVTSAILLYGLVGLPPQLFVWNGSLLPGQTVNINLPILPIVAGEHILQVSCSSPNGDQDQVPGNDTWTYSFVANVPAENVSLLLVTDNFGSDVTWTLASSTGAVLYSGGPYANVNGGQTIQVPFCLTNGCYTFTVIDLFGDGICCGSGNGYLNITNADGLVYVESDGQYGAQLERVFCIQGVDVAEMEGPGSLRVWPNPAQDELFLELEGAPGTWNVSLVDGLGRRVRNAVLPGGAGRSRLDLGGMAPGLYVVEATHPRGRLVQRVLLRH